MSTQHRSTAVPQPGRTAIEQRVSLLDWSGIEADLHVRGSATSGPILTASECKDLIRNYDLEDAYRSRVVMARHGFGKGEYKYYKYPLPQLIAELRSALYSRLASVANSWNEALSIDRRFPSTHESYLRLCHKAGQRLPTPLILKYGEDDYNCLHRDLYGDLVFPLQVTILLSARGEDFSGGDFVLTEQRPRMQSRVEVVPLEQGEAVIFAVNQRPVRGTRGVYRVGMRHGVSRIRSGQRFTLGIIFHDAK
jgi:uncharacterized protein